MAQDVNTLYHAAMSLHAFLEEGKFDTLDSVSEAITSNPQALDIGVPVLYRQLTTMQCLHIDNVDDLREAVGLLSVNDNGIIRNGGDSLWWSSIREALFSRNPTKYYDEEPNCVVITDTDFLNIEELLPDDYQVIYGVLYAKQEDSIYQTYMLTLRKVGTTIFRKICLTSWEELLNGVIERLVEIQDRYKGKTVRVRVPFFYYDEDISKTVALYKFARFIVRTLKNDGIFEDEEVDEREYHAVPQLFEAFEKLMNDYHVDDRQDLEVYVLDEMIRRGLTCDMKPSSEYSKNGYRSHILRDRTAYLDSYKSEEEKTEGELINRVGVLYCMLYGHVENNSLLTKIAHFALNDRKPFKERTSSNTEYTYIAHPLERLFDTFEKKGFIEGKLKDYGFPGDTMSKIVEELRNK